MVIGRIKILLIVFLILGLCLLFFKKTKEGFGTTTPPAWGADVGYQTGTLGTFRGNGGALSPQSFLIDPYGVLNIGNIDNNGNDINAALLTKITNLKSRLLNNRVTLTISYLNRYSYVSLESVDLTLHGNPGGFDMPGYRLYTSFLDENDPITQGMPSGSIDATGAEINIYWRSSANCAITPWSSYNTCTATDTATCEPTATSQSGTLTNTRIFIPPFGTDDTSTCGPMKTYELTQTVPCSLGICPPTNCRPGEWSDSGTCTATGTATCEPTATSQSGTKTQTRTVAPATNGGTCSTADSATTQTVPCSLSRCPINCLPGAWTNSGTCAARPGGSNCEVSDTSISGTQLQIRSFTPAQFGGLCPNSNTSQTIDCKLPNRCPTNCVPGQWTNLETCVPAGTATCEPTATSQSGIQIQTRTIEPPTNGGTCSTEDSSTTRTVPCSLARCPTNCVPGQWTDSGTCMATGTATCEPTATSQSGTKTQTRTVTPAQFGGTCTDSSTTRTVPCSLARCSINCAPGQWTDSGTCTATGTTTCEPTATSQSGTKIQTRTVTPSQFGGTCSAEDSLITRNIPCSLARCPTNCVPGQWTNFGTCTASSSERTCETSTTSLSGKQIQTRIIVPATNGGSCPDNSMNRTIDCALSRCPIDCVTGPWSNSGTCTSLPGASNCEPTATSRSGKQTQLREITPAQFGGSCTDSATSKTIDCALSTRCPVPCGLSAWANTGSCENTSNINCEPTATSMSGFQKQFQTITSPAQFGGECPITSPNTSNIQIMPCRLSNLPRCSNPFNNQTLVNLLTIDHKDFPTFGTFPNNDVRFTPCNVGDTIVTVY